MCGTAVTCEPFKDSEAENPVPDVWRPIFRDIVHAFVEGDYALARGVRSVTPPAPGVAEQMKAYVAEYGGGLAELPEEAWKGSASLWMSSSWDVFVDLWTVESGKSDMVLAARVFEAGDGYRVEIHGVHVP